MYENITKTYLSTMNEYLPWLRGYLYSVQHNAYGETEDAVDANRSMMEAFQKELEKKRGSNKLDLPTTFQDAITVLGIEEQSRCLGIPIIQRMNVLLAPYMEAELWDMMKSYLMMIEKEPTLYQEVQLDDLYCDLMQLSCHVNREEAKKLSSFLQHDLNLSEEEMLRLEQYLMRYFRQATRNGISSFRYQTATTYKKPEIHLEFGESDMADQIGYRILDQINPNEDRKYKLVIDIDPRAMDEIAVREAIRAGDVDQIHFFRAPFHNHHNDTRNIYEITGHPPYSRDPNGLAHFLKDTESHLALGTQNLQIEIDLDYFYNGSEEDHGPILEQVFQFEQALGVETSCTSSMRLTTDVVNWKDFIIGFSDVLGKRIDGILTLNDFTKNDEFEAVCLCRNGGIRDINLIHT